jgi:hypothetical protein
VFFTTTAKQKKLGVDSVELYWRAKSQSEIRGIL